MPRSNRQAHPGHLAPPLAPQLQVRLSVHRQRPCSAAAAAEPHLAWQPTGHHTTQQPPPACCAPRRPATPSPGPTWFDLVNVDWNSSNLEPYCSTWALRDALAAASSSFCSLRGSMALAWAWTSAVPWASSCRGAGVTGGIVGRWRPAWAVPGKAGSAACVQSDQCNWSVSG